MDKRKFLKAFNQTIKDGFDEFLAIAGFKLESENIEEYHSARIYVNEHVKLYQL